MAQRAETVLSALKVMIVGRTAVFAVGVLGELLAGLRMESPVKLVEIGGVDGCAVVHGAVRSAEKIGGVEPYSVRLLARHVVVVGWPMRRL